MRELNSTLVVAAAAYMSCSRLYNDYDGIEHDYTKKHGLVHQEILVPPTAPTEWADREKLWNAVEETEKTKDSRLAREFVAVLPTELSKEDWIELLRQYISDNFVSEAAKKEALPHPNTKRHRLTGGKNSISTKSEKRRYI